mgnify:CR=1 FL=1|jgi:hypothetical protein
MAASFRTCMEVPETYIKYAFGECVELDQSYGEEEEEKSSIVKRSIKTFGWKWKGTCVYNSIV